MLTNPLTQDTYQVVNRREDEEDHYYDNQMSNREMDEQFFKDIGKHNRRRDYPRRRDVVRAQ